MLKIFVPMLCELVLKLLADKEFKKLIWEIAQLELAWITGELKGETALDRIWELIQDYFVDGPEFKGLGVYNPDPPRKLYAPNIIIR